jgi:beta-N-acetylhexosaminidase
MKISAKTGKVKGPRVGAAPVLLALAALLLVSGCAGTRRTVAVPPGATDVPILRDAGRVFVLPLLAPALSDEEIGIARTIRPAGYLVFGGAVVSRTQFAGLMSAVRGIVPDDAVRVMIDEEGGRVSRLAPLVGRRRSQRERGEAGDTNAERLFAASNARLLRSFGIDTVLAPVADVLYEKGSRVLKDRSFGSDPALVGRMVRASLRGYADENFDCVLKHFPGHGSVPGDTHSEGPVLSKPLAELEAGDLRPYREAAAEGLPFSIMMSHLLWKEADPDHPASLSGEAVARARAIPGFGGLILTDDLSMAAVTNRIPLRETAVRAVSAGADLLLYSSDWKNILSAWSNLGTSLRKDPAVAEKFRARAARSIGKK